MNEHKSHRATPWKITTIGENTAFETKYMGLGVYCNSRFAMPTFFTS